MKKLVCLLVGAAALGFVAQAYAQPACIDLGVIGDTTAVYTTPDFSFVDDPVGASIHWYCFTILEATSAAGKFLDIDLNATGTTSVPDTEIGLYDSLGNLIANDDDDGHSLRSALTFGNTTPRTMPPDPFGYTNGVAHNGRDGNLAAGTYYLSVSLYNTTFASGWTVTTSATSDPNPVTVNFRTDLANIPEPASAGLTLGALVLGGLFYVRRRRK